MRIPVYQIDAFTDRPFAGNPAAVMPLQAWLSSDLMQSIAAENNLSETAFFVSEGDGYHIRWFTPESEIDLCGHATLASAFVILTELDKQGTRVAFRSQSGTLIVTRDGDLLCLDFPSRPPRAIAVPEGLASALGATVLGAGLSRDLLVELESESSVRELKPDMAALARLEPFGVIVTARGETADFVSRYFAPKAGIPEDPVTGSAHCTLIPFWADRLGKTKLHARQISVRGGELFCELRGDRVKIAGKAVKVLEGTFMI